MASVSQQMFLSVGGGTGGPTDPSFASVVLLLGFEDVNGSTGAPGFTDESTANNKGAGSLSASGPVIDTSTSEFGSSSLHISGTGQLEWADDADWNFTGNFTVECWINPATITGTHDIVGQWALNAGDAAWMLYQDTSAVKFKMSTTGSNSLVDLASSTGLVSTGTWYALAVDFDGTKYRLYLNGTMVASSTTLRTLHNSAFAFSVGAEFGSGGIDVNVFNGHIDEIRITKGVARYASDSGYTIATAAFPRS